MYSLRKCLHVDVGEDDIMQDVDSVDLVELSDAVAELKQRDVVHCHPERFRSAQDLHLERSKAQQHSSFLTLILQVIMHTLPKSSSKLIYQSLP